MKKRVAMILANIGKSMAKAEINVNSPWIHFQPIEPEVVTRMRLGGTKHLDSGIPRKKIHAG